MRGKHTTVSVLLWIALFWVGPTSSANAEQGVQDLWVSPPAGELIARPTLFVVVQTYGEKRRQALLVSDGDFVLEPVSERDSVLEVPSGPVPLNLVGRYVVDEGSLSLRYMALELRPRDELVAGVNTFFEPCPEALQRSSTRVWNPEAECPGR